jgi:hypothetical protein
MMANPGGVMACQLERTEFIVIPGPQISAVCILRRKLQPVDTDEEIEAVVETVGVKLDMTQMRDGPHQSSSTVRGNID